MSETAETWTDAEGKTRPERRRQVHITEAQIDMIAEIAEKAAEKAVARMIDTGYRAVGKNIVEKGFWVVGLVSCGIFGFMVAKGWIKV